MLVSNFLVFFFSYGRGDYSVFYAVLYFSSISFLPFNFLWLIFILSCLLCVVSFSFIPRLLRARSHNFSGELCSALLSPSFRTFVGPVFSNIALATLLSSISYYNKPQHIFNSFTVSKIYLYTMGYVFGVGVTDCVPAYFSFLTFQFSQ